MRYAICGIVAGLVLGAGMWGHGAAPVDEDPAWAPPPLERAISIRDGRTNTDLSLDDLVQALAKADVVFLGETHNDETTHRVELVLFDGLLRQRPEHVVLALEMFERDVQQQIDAYLGGELTEAAFRAHTRAWGNYRTGYRALVERAKTAGTPVLASNFPRPLLMRMRMGGAEPQQTFESLRNAHSDELPAQLFPNTPGYWRRVDNAIRGHLAMMRPGGAADERLFATQSLWDNTMADTCAQALDRHPGSLILHVNGGFHSAYWDGTVHQLATRKPQARIKTVSIVPVANPSVAKWTGSPVADYVVFVEKRGEDETDGYWSVAVLGKVKYRLHVPQPDGGGPWPLLIWLSDDGLTVDDGLDLWKSRLGDEAVIAVVAPPYRETQEDFSTGGRWYWPEDFTDDVGTAIGGVEQIWAYLVRNLDVDPHRVCVAGEGTGGTVAAAATVLADEVPIHGVALAPRQYAKLTDFPLPLPELAGDDPPASRRLVVVGTASDEAWWATELQQYQGVGLDVNWVTATDDPWFVERQQEERLRAALGLAPPAVVADGPRQYLVLDSDLMRARHWARLQALQAAARSGRPVAVVTQPPAGSADTELAIAIAPNEFGKAGALPLCPGPFGGTTVLVLPAGMEPDQAAQWRALEASDPIARTSRFHRLRVAEADGPQGLVPVLEQLRSAGRKNVLVVPAVFCADPEWMRQLRRSVRPLENDMTLHWLPGLGGQLLSGAP